MKIVFKRSEILESAVSKSYQIPFPERVRCTRSGCEGEATLYMLINDDEQELLAERPVEVKVWPHDSSTVAVYLCTNCGAMRARWNQG